MSRKINCWYSTEFEMRAGQSGWTNSGSAEVTHDGRRILKIARAMSGTLRSSWKSLREPEMPTTGVETIWHGDDPVHAKVTIQVELDLDRFGRGDLGDDDDDRAKNLARQALLRQHPKTHFYQTPQSS